MKPLAMQAAAIGAAICLSASAAPAQQLNWDMQSTYPGTLTQLGTLGKYVAERLELVSGGQIKLTFREPGAIVPALEAFDAVASGAIQAAWSTPGYWIGKEPALAMFSAVPFGPGAGEYFAWIKFGGGKELLEEIYAHHGLHSVICGVIAPEASGWFRKEINSVEDLRGLKMRFFGLGAKVMEKMGVSTQLLAAGDIFQALELGTIDATEFSMPAIDLNLGFHQVAKNYYFPGWHQQSTLFEVLVNKTEWDGLNETQKAQFETVCDAAFAYGLAEGEAIQVKALQELKDKGVNIRRWSPEALQALNAAWEEVVEEQKQNANFAKAWDSLQQFREEYATWRDLGYIQPSDLIKAGQ